MDFGTFSKFDEKYVFWKYAWVWQVVRLQVTPWWCQFRQIWSERRSKIHEKCPICVRFFAGNSQIDPPPTRSKCANHTRPGYQYRKPWSDVKMYTLDIVMFYNIMLDIALPLFVGENSYPNWGKDTRYGITHLSHMEPSNITIYTVETSDIQRGEAELDII